MKSTLMKSRPATKQKHLPDNRTQMPDGDAQRVHHSLADTVLDEVDELREEITETAEEAVEQIEESRAGRWAIGAYVWLMDKAPKSTRGRVIFAVVLMSIVLVPSLAMLYVSITEGQAGTEAYFG